MGDDGGKSPQESMGDILQALQKHYPGMSKVVRDQFGPNADAELNLVEKYSPKFAEAQYKNMDTWGRKLAALGRDLAGEEQMGAAETEAKVAAGPGRELARTAKELQTEIDPEFFKQRQAQSNALDKLEAATDPTKLTGDEQESVARGLGRTMYSVPSAQNATRAAMTFGDRLKEKRAEYRSLIDTRTSALPAMKSGLEGFAAATKRSVTPNVGLQNYTGLQQPGQQQSNSVFGQFMQPAGSAMAINMGKEASDWDKYNMGVGAVGNTLGVVGKLAGGIMGGVCWIARAAYGETDPRWIMFRSWLYNKAPQWFFNWYLKNGEEFAESVKASPLLAKMVRGLMNLVIA